MNKTVLGVVLTLFFLIPVLVFAEIGVGVGTGKIEVKEPLSAGAIYDISPITVFNTGDQTSEYVVTIEYRDNAPELKPKKEWFEFSPTQFELEPGQAQKVDIKLNLPIKGVVPGDYFAFLSAHPVQKSESGSTIIGIAAATKFYFTAKPANIFQGIYHRFISLYLRAHPWDTIVLSLIIVALLIMLFKSKFNIQIAKK